LHLVGFLCELYYEAQIHNHQMILMLHIHDLCMSSCYV